MSDDLAQDYLAGRDVDPELEADLGRFRNVGNRADERGFMSQLKERQVTLKQTAEPLGDFILNLPRNITVGVADAAINTLAIPQDLAQDATEAAGGAVAPNVTPPGLPSVMLEGLKLIRGELASSDDTVSDEIVQSAAQFMIPFAAYSKMLGGFSLVKGLIAETETMLTAFGPHEGRFADLLRLLDTNNTLVNSYIDFLGTEEGEGEVEGRFKNAVDSLAVTAGISGIVKSGAEPLRAARRAPTAASAPPATQEPFAYTPASTLNPQERELETAFGAQIGEDIDRAIAEYAKVPGTDGGRILNTDLARELDETYRGNRSTLSVAVHEPASALVKRMYTEMLAAPLKAGQTPTVIFTGGGTGAGKTTAIAKLAPAARDAQIIYDTNLNGLQSSVDKIEQALDADKQVSIFYVWRDPVDSLVHGALPRAMRMGRTVPLIEHARTHSGAAETVRALMERYNDDPRVAIRVIDNSHGPGGASLSSIDVVQEVEYNSLVGKLHEALEKEFEAGRISEAVYRGTLGEIPARNQSGGSRSNRRGNGAQSERADEASDEIKAGGG